MDVQGYLGCGKNRDGGHESSFKEILNFRANGVSRMRKIQQGDDVFISDIVDIRKYRECDRLGWDEEMAEHLGKSGKVLMVIEGPEMVPMVDVELSAYQTRFGRPVFRWLLDDVSLRPVSRWRRQDLEGRK